MWSSGHSLNVFVPAVRNSSSVYRIELNGPEYYTIAFIEGFDLSENQTTGGLVNIVAGGVNNSSLTMDLFHHPTNADINMFLVVYVNICNGGKSFRIGRIVPSFNVYYK